MVSIDVSELEDAIKDLKIKGEGRKITIYINGSVLELKTMDSTANEVVVKLFDAETGMLPKLTTTGPLPRTK